MVPSGQWTVSKAQRGRCLFVGIADDIFPLAVRKFQNTVSGFIQWALHTDELWCDELGLSFNLAKLGFSHSLAKGNSQRSLNLVYSGLTFIVQFRSSISELSWIKEWTGRNTWSIRRGRLKMRCGHAGGRVVWSGVWDPVWFIGCTSLSSGRPSPCILGMVAWLLDCHWKVEIEQYPKINLLRDNRSCANHSHQWFEALICLLHWRQGFSVRRGQLPFDPGMWDARLTYIPIENTVVSWCDFNSQIPCLIWGAMLWGEHSILNPNIGLSCWRGMIVHKIGAPYAVKGSSGLQIGPGKGWKPWLESMGNL